MTCPASFAQNGFRGRNDDGNETTATWKAAQNTNWSQAVDTNFRVRFQIQEGAACAGANKQWRLQYNLNSAGYVNVTATSSVVRASASGNLADAANLTDQLTGGTGTFQGATGFDEVDGICGGSSMDVAASGHAEAEFCVQLRSAETVAGDTIALRITDNGTAIASYTQTPTVTRSSGNITVTPTTLALVTATFAPVIKLVVIPPIATLSISTFASAIGQGVVPTTLAIVTTGFAPVIKLTVIPSTLALTLATFAPTVTVGGGGTTVTPTTLALTISTFAPVFGGGVVPTTKALSLTTFAPVFGGGVVPPTLALTIATFAPTVSAPRLVTPTTLALTVSTFAPVFGGGVVPITKALTISTFAPTVSAPRLVTPTTLALTISTFAPVVSVGIRTTPTTLALTIATFAPTIQTPVLATPTTKALTISTFAPAIGQGVVPTTKALIITAFAPVFGGGVVPTTLALTISTFAPVIGSGIIPPTKALSLTTFAPTIGVGVSATPTTKALVLATFVPSVTVDSGPITIVPEVATLLLHRFSPNAYERVINPAVDGIVIIPPKNTIGWAGGRGGTKLPLTSSKPAVEILGHYNLAKKSNEIARQQKQAKQAKTIVEILTIISDGDLW